MPFPVFVSRGRLMLGRNLAGLRPWTAEDGRPHMSFFQEDAAGVAQPDTVGGPAMKSNVRGESIGALEHSAGLSRE